VSPSGRVVAVGHVGIAAGDVESLAGFYRDVVGLKLAIHHAGVIAIFEVGDVDVFVLPGQTAPVEFDFAADDVDALRQRLVSRSVPCDEPQDDKRSGHRRFTFTDPEGNRVQVVDVHPRLRA
jgi:predicted enzyme related to lactoylglutathione lyase